MDLGHLPDDVVVVLVVLQQDDVSQHCPGVLRFSLLQRRKQVQHVEQLIVDLGSIIELQKEHVIMNLSRTERMVEEDSRPPQRNKRPVTVG